MPQLSKRIPSVLFTVAILSTELFLLVATSLAQSGAVIPQGGAGHANQASCVLLKRMGPADQITSHLYSFGIRGKQFQYIEGKLPEGFPFHGRLTDHDVRNLQGRGAEVIVLNQNYTAEELSQARADCRGETGKTPLQSEQASKPEPASPQTLVGTSAPGAEIGGLTDLEISSNPPAGDIEIDGKFVGNTPSSVSVGPGDHEIAIRKHGFAIWSRKIATSGGRVNISAELLPAQ